MGKEAPRDICSEAQVLPSIYHVDFRLRLRRSPDRQYIQQCYSPFTNLTYPSTRLSASWCGRVVHTTRRVRSAVYRLLCGFVGSSSVSSHVQGEFPGDSADALQRSRWSFCCAITWAERGDSTYVSSTRFRSPSQRPPLSHQRQPRHPTFFCSRPP